MGVRNTKAPGMSDRKGHQQRLARRRLMALVQEGLSSPIEPPDPAYWNKRRQALQRSIAKKQR